LQGGIGLVVIDEDFAAMADRIFRLGLGVLDANTVHKFPIRKRGEPDAPATVDLQVSLHTPLIKASQACFGGYLTLREAGFTADAAERRSAATSPHCLPATRQTPFGFRGQARSREHGCTEV
jgi:hypothetical protein